MIVAKFQMIFSTVGGVLEEMSLAELLYLALANEPVRQ